MNGYFGEELLRALEEANPFTGRTVRQADRERYEVRPPEVGGDAGVYANVKRDDEEDVSP